MLELSGLKPIYKIIRQNNETYAFFYFKKNGVTFHVFFDIEITFENKNYSLGFIVPGTQFNLWINVTEDFRIDTYIKDKFIELKKVLNLKGNSYNSFSTNAFFEEFNQKIPSESIKPSKKILHEIATKRYNIEESKKIYYLTFKRLPEGQHRTLKNTEKTRLLFPKIYERIKYRANISICYTPIPNNREEDDI